MLKALVLLCLTGLSIEGQSSDNNQLQKYLDEGERALAEHHRDEAERAFEKLAQLDPGSAELRAKLAIIYFQDRKFEQAAQSLRAALKLKPDLTNADVFLAMSLSELGRFSEALPGLEKGFRRSGDRELKRMAGLQLTRAYTDLRQDNKAVEVALELTRLYPEDAEVLYHAGRLFGNYAYLTMRKLSEVAPSSGWKHQAAGEAYESEGDYGLAVTEYKAVLALSPARPGIHFRLGRVLLLRSQQGSSQADDLGEASKEFDQELRLDPTNANAAYERGEIYRKAGEYAKAHELFEIALRYYPNFQQAQVAMGRVMIALDKPSLALPYLRKAIALNPEDTVPYYHVAQVYGALGNVAEQQKSLAEFRRLRSQAADRREAVNNVFAPQEVTKQELDPHAALP